MTPAAGKKAESLMCRGKIHDCCGCCPEGLEGCLPRIEMDSYSESQLVDGEIEDFLGFRAEAIKKWKGRMDENLVERLAIIYGMNSKKCYRRGTLERPLNQAVMKRLPRICFRTLKRCLPFVEKWPRDSRIRISTD